MSLFNDVLIKELIFKTSRSGGNGGQNVNKVSSKVEVIWELEKSQAFIDEEKSILRKNLKNKIDKEGFLHVVTQESVSQLTNKNKGIEKLIDLLIHSLHVPKVRKATKLPKSAKISRTKFKLLNSQKKINRKPVRLE